MVNEPDRWVRMIHGRGPLESRDLVSNAHYQQKRSKWLAIGRAEKLARRIRLGDHLSLLFENRMSVWLQIQEELRWIESPTPAQVEELLGRYNPLIARPGQLCASLFLDSSDPVALTRYALGFTASRLNLRLLLHGRLMAARSLERQASGLDAVTYLRFVSVRRAHSDRDALYWTDPTCREVCLPESLRSALKADLQGRSLALSGPLTAPGFRSVS